MSCEDLTMGAAASVSGGGGEQEADFVPPSKLPAMVAADSQLKEYEAKLEGNGAWTVQELKEVRKILTNLHSSLNEYLVEKRTYLQGIRSAGQFKEKMQKLEAADADDRELYRITKKKADQDSDSEAWKSMVEHSQQFQNKVRVPVRVASTLTSFLTSNEQPTSPPPSICLAPRLPSDCPANDGRHGQALHRSQGSIRAV